jgi:hypothetical protein
VLLVVVGGAIAVVVAAIVGLVIVIVQMITWLEKAVMWFENMAGAAGRAAGQIVADFGAITGNPVVHEVLHVLQVPGFALGGIVPGAEGSPQLIVAHGGEQVRTRAQQGGGGQTVNITINTVVADGPSLDRFSLEIARRLSYATGR